MDETILSNIKNDILPEIYKKLPYLENNCGIILYGSAARGDMIEASDIDLMLFMPRETKLLNLDQLYKVKIDLEKNKQIQMVFRNDLEDLTDDKIWNDDMLLGVLQESVILYDPLKIIKKTCSFTSHFPEEVLREKVIFTGLEIIKSRKELKSQLQRKNTLEVLWLKLKLIKLLIIILELSAGNFYNLKYLYINFLTNKNFLKFHPVISNLISNIDDDSFDENLNSALQQTEDYLVDKNFLSSNFFEEFHWWKKNLRYKITKI